MHSGTLEEIMIKLGRLARLKFTSCSSSWINVFALNRLRLSKTKNSKG